MEDPVPSLFFVDLEKPQKIFPTGRCIRPESRCFRDARADLHLSFLSHSWAPGRSKSDIFPKGGDTHAMFVPAPQEIPFCLSNRAPAREI
ncbi:MAG: hypothetical protein C6P37_15735 [Caldibacillus debilis]|uniref:Uncharacterized protein n=1 Tax=Caldibacillus debilis TaxID=301148 RepID=A0A3E0JXT5_9BACI|nr:MAG: hypothetical protein C6P37_15735 [Caldibacillus debilis]REJ26220.1 MAG: hypothetical protein C6W56_12560 [Caldibacillus debilis]